MKLDQDFINKISGFRRELSRDDAPAECERVAGLYPRGFLSIVASPAGSGKTWLMQYVSCQLSIGGKILNGLAESEPRKVLILTGETGADLLNRRLAKTLWPYNGENIAVYSAIDMGLSEVDYQIDTETGRAVILAILTKERPDVVFFDTLISFHGLDESRQGEMTKIYMFLCRLAKMFDCAVVCNHHTRKRPADNPARRQNQDDVIGTSAGVRLASSVYVVSQSVDETGENEEIMTVRNVKDWDKKIRPFSYQFVTDEVGFIDFNIVLNVGGRAPKTSCVDDFIASQEVGALLKISDVATACNVSEAVARYHMKKSKSLKEGYLLGEKVYEVI